MYSEAEETREGDYVSLRAPFLADGLAAVRNFLGGAPTAVLSKLALLSVVVGGILSSIRFNPVDLFYGMVRAANSAFGIAVGIASTLVQYLLIGLIVVAPIWLILRWYSFRQERTAATDAAE